MKLIFLPPLLMLLIASGCSYVENAVQTAIVETLTALPPDTPRPFPTRLPSPTPLPTADVDAPDLNLTAVQAIEYFSDKFRITFTTDDFPFPNVFTIPNPMDIGYEGEGPYGEYIRLIARPTNLVYAYYSISFEEMRDMSRFDNGLTSLDFMHYILGDALYNQVVYPLYFSEFNEQDYLCFGNKILQKSVSFEAELATTAIVLREDLPEYYLNPCH